MNNELRFSIIVPVYNRPDEMRELLASLAAQTDRAFEVMVMEDECSNSCESICKQYSSQLDIRFYRDKAGRSVRRNLGMQRAAGNYFLLFDSDVILPANYIGNLRKALTDDYVDCYGGPDSADSSFTDLQLAINYSMTSIMTTGGIRGGMKNVDKYLPRAFNMGFSKRVFESTGGYMDMIGEDVDLSMRIKEAGFRVRLIRQCVVFHKRRITMRGFFRQTNTFGKARVLLSLRHPGSLKIMHLFPSCFLVGNAGLVLLSALTFRVFWLLPIAAYVLALFAESLARNRSARVAMLSVLASYVQLCGYGAGLIEEFVTRKASKKATSEALYRQS